MKVYNSLYVARHFYIIKYVRFVLGHFRFWWSMLGNKKITQFRGIDLARKS